MPAYNELLQQVAWIAGAPYDYGEGAVGYYDDHRNHVLVRDFELSGEAAAAGGFELALAVLGLAKVSLNGQALGNVELLGHWTNFTKAVYFDVFDVSALVQAGKNTLQIELGNGFYNPAPITLFGKYNLRERLAEVGTPHVAAVLCQGEETLLQTDASWGVREGGLLFNNMYLGERADLRACAGETQPATAYSDAPRNLLAAPLAPCRRFEEFEAASVADTPEGVLVDFGQIVSGTIDLRFSAAEGQTVDITYAEDLRDGKMYYASNVAGLVGMETPRGVCPGGPGAPVPAVQRDVLTCAEGENAYASSFTYHSFRYVLLAGLSAADISAIRAVSVHTELARIGTLSTGAPEFDQLLQAAVNTKLNNVHDVFEDCSRERFGYGGDMVSLANSNFMLFDEGGLLDKTLADFGRDQTERGGLPETAPFMGIGSNGPAYGEGPLLWQLAYPYLAVQADRYFGRADLIAREWPGLVRFGDYLLSFEPEDLAGHCLGDHGSILTGGAEGFKNGTPDKELLGWCAILWSLKTIAEAGERMQNAGLGEAADAERFAAAAAGLRQQIVERFQNEDGSFGDATQTSCAFAGMLGLDSMEDQAARLVADVQAREGVFTTGIFGTMLAFDMLHRTGHDDVVEAWLLRRDHPSLLSMLEGGNATLAEQFTEELSSFNHAMFSSYAQWLFQALGGIRVADDAVACDKVIIDPALSAAAGHVACSYATPQGTISLSWKLDGENAQVELLLPAGVAADYTALEGKDNVQLKVSVA